MSWWLYILTWEHNQFASLSRDGWDHTKLFSFIWRKFIQQQVSIYSNVTCFTYDANYYDSISTFQNVYFHVSFCILECKRNMTNAVTLNCQTELCWITYRTPYMNHLIYIWSFVRYKSANWVFTGLCNGLPLARRRAITRTNADILSIGPSPGNQNTVKFWSNLSFINILT